MPRPSPAWEAQLVSRHRDNFRRAGYECDAAVPGVVRYTAVSPRAECRTCPSHPRRGMPDVLSDAAVPRRRTAHGIACITRAAPPLAGCRARRSPHAAGQRAAWLRNPGGTPAGRIPSAPLFPARDGARRYLHHPGGAPAGRLPSSPWPSPARDDARRGSCKPGDAPAGRVPIVPRPSPVETARRRGLHNAGGAPTGRLSSAPRPSLRETARGVARVILAVLLLAGENATRPFPALDGSRHPGWRRRGPGAERQAPRSRFRRGRRRAWLASPGRQLAG